MAKWVQTVDYKVKRGEEVLNIGDYIDYHDCAGENGKDLYEGRWQVLGTDNEGNLLIVSEDKVTTHYFNKEYTLEGAMEAYSTAVDTLDKICEVYGKGIGAINARSIRIEDVDILTGYDKTTDSDYGKSYTSKNKKGDTFIWHDGTCWHKTRDSKKISLTNTYYWYDNINNLPTKVYDMLFGKRNKYYWLGSSYVTAGSAYAGFGLRRVNGGYVDGNYFVYSYGVCNLGDYGVRAVVSLEADVSI